MPSSPFVGAWTIESWNPDDRIVAEGIPVDGFLVGAPLNITQPSSEVDLFSLQWSTQNQHTAVVSGLQPAPQFPMPTIIGENRQVSFGAKNVQCNLTLALIDQVLHGTISVAGSTSTDREGPDTGSGTFTATANGGPGTVVYTED